MSPVGRLLEGESASRAKDIIVTAWCEPGRSTGEIFPITAAARWVPLSRVCGVRDAERDVTLIAGHVRNPLPPRFLH